MGKRRKRKSERSVLKWAAKNWIFSLIFLVITGNFVFQVAQKPAEVMSFFSGSLSKTPVQTWSSYGDSFEENKTRWVSPYLLAAIAQIESGGNPWASPKWNFNFNRPWYKIYAPASSSTGIMQFTEGTFLKATKYCVHRGKVLKDGPWHKWNSCWGNFLYTRLWPSHAIELTAAYLHLAIDRIARQFPKYNFSERQLVRLASAIHLCGEKQGERLARSGMRISSGKKCGSHNLSRYVSRAQKLARQFRNISARN